jgi:hypothetical protein
VNRMSTDGTIVALRKDGANVGSLGTASGSMYIEGNPATSKTGLTFFGASIEPRDAGAASNGVVDLGSSGSRFKDLHLSGAVNAGGSASFSADAINIELIETNVADENTRFRQNAGNLDIQTIDDASSNSKNRLRVDHSSGDISFYEDTGNTPKMVWKSASESLGIGTTLPNRKLTVQGPVGSLADFTSTTSTTGAGISFGDTNTSSNYVRIRAIGNEMQLYAGNLERMRIDADGKIGMGSIDPDRHLDVVSAENVLYGPTVRASAGVSHRLFNTTNATGRYAGITLASNNSAGTTSEFTLSNVSTSSNYQGVLTLQARTGSSTYAERLRVDKSGNFLLGKSALEYENTTGHIFRNDGFQSSIRSGGNVADFNRLSSDGEIIRLSKDGATVGNIGTFGGTTYFSSNTHAIMINGTAITPSLNTGNRVDGAMDLGASGYRFKDAYLSGGVYLGGTGSANKLEDYEEGSWTPVIRRVDGTTGATFNFATANYVKVGRLVTIKVFVYNLVAGSSNGSSYWTILGVPFLGQPYSSSYLGGNSTSPNNCYIGDAGGNIIFTNYNSAYSGSLTGSFMLNMTYETNS